MTVQITLHAKIENVSILVQKGEFVLLMLFVLSLDIRLFVHVQMGILVHLK